MDKKEKKPGLNRKGLDTMGKRLLVLTLAILMTFQFCTPTFSGVSFAEDEVQQQETVEQAETAVTEEAPAEVQEETPAPVEEAAVEQPVQEEQQPVTEETGEVSGEVAAEEQVPEEVAEEPAPSETPAAPAQEEPQTETPDEPQAETPLNTEVMTLNGGANGVTVTVTAEPGTFPEGTDVDVRKIRGEDASGAVNEALGEAPAKFRAVEITFEDAEGNDVDPQKTLTVNLASTALSSDADLKVVDVENAEEVTDTTKADDGTVTINADGATTLALTEPAIKAAGDGEEATGEAEAAGDPITVHFDPNTEPEGQLALIDVTVNEGEEIGDQLPAVPTVPGYNTKWVVGKTEITKETVVNEEFTAVVGKDKIVYTVTFLNEDGTTLKTVNVDIDNGFAVGSADYPAVPEKPNKIGKWVIQETDTEFPVGTRVSADTTVVPAYEQNIFTVNFVVEADKTQNSQLTTANGTTIVLPSDPIVPGKTFVGWFTKPDGQGTQYTASSTVNEDLTLYAYFEGQVTVKFLVKDDDGNIITSKSQYFVDVTVGDQITTLPDDPFVEGKVFDHWEHETAHTPVAVGTTVTESFNAVAVFKTIDTYELTVNYFYMNGDNRVPVGTQVYELTADDLENGYTVTAPGYTIATEISQKPTYYPSQPTITVTKNQFTKGADGKYTLTVEDKFVAADAAYKVGHYLKNLDGNGYTLIETVNKVGVKNSKVTPDINNYAYADYESRDVDVTITDDPDQELKVYYTRRGFTLSYNVGAGDYIDAVTAPYGTQITLPASATRKGYTFAGWYKDSEYTQSASSPFTLEENTTLYAKWTPAQSEYKVVYMRENANDDGYSYFGTVTLTAPTDSEVTANASTPKPANWDATNFTFKEATTETVNADGSTVVIVKYSRNVYTITWEGSGYEIHSSWGGSYTQWHTGRGRATLTAKYGADISAQWNATFNTPHPDWAWNFSSTENDEKFTSLDIMPSGNRTVYHWYYSTTKTQTLNYWFENYEGSQTKTYNGRTYGLFKAVTVHYNYLYDTDYPDYAGYTKGGWVRSDGARSLTASTPNGNLTADFYYNALQYPLTFYNYDGSLISTTQVTLNENIYNRITGAIPTPPMEGATWKGWYTDSEHENAYTYNQNTKMPTGLALYGDFEFPTRTVTFDMQGGTWTDTDNETYSHTGDTYTQTDEYGFYAKKPDDPTKANYTFQGWYTAAGETGSPYDWNKPVTENTTLYAHWTQDTISYTVHYYEKGTTTKVADDKIVSNPDFREGQEITENALTVAGHVVDKASQTIQLSFDEENNTIIFYYDTIPGTLEYTVNYVLKDHPEIKVAESKTVTVPGSTTNAMEMAVEANKAYMETQTSDADILGQHYKPTETSKELQLAIDNNVITFEYIPYTTTKITVNYLDMDGKTIHASDTAYVEKGDTFTVQNKAPEGFVYHHAYLDGTTTAPQATYQITGNEGNIVINAYYQKKLIIIANNKAKTYDGEALASSFDTAADYTVTGIARGDLLTSLEFDGSQTNAGSSATTPKNAVITLGDTGNVAPETYYSIVYVPGSLTVRPVSVYISVAADQWNTHSGGSGPNYYTGQTFNVGFTNTGKQHFNDDTSKSAYVSITSGERDLFKAKYGDAIWNALYGTNGTLISQKDAGTYTVTGEAQRAMVAGVTVNGQEMMSDPNYSITIYARDSFLTIEPLPLTIKTASDSKTYDGTPLTKDEDASIEYNYWTANIGGEWTADTEEPGTIILGTGDTIGFSVDGSRTEPGSSDNTVDIDWKEANSANYVINYQLGTLTVDNPTLKITVKDKTTPYNGTEQKGYLTETVTVTGTGSTITTGEYIIEGLAKDQVLTISGYTPSSGTDANETPYDNGSFENATITIMSGEGEDAVDVTNFYTIGEKTPGKLIITPADLEVTVRIGDRWSCTGSSCCKGNRCRRRNKS